MFHVKHFIPHAKPLILFAVTFNVSRETKSPERIRALHVNLTFNNICLQNRNICYL